MIVVVVTPSNAKLSPRIVNVSTWVLKFPFHRLFLTMTEDPIALDVPFSP
jgi:hypothetical protein